MSGAPAIHLGAAEYKAVREMAANGMSKDLIAQALGISPRSLYRHIGSDGALKEALARGYAKDLGACINVLRDKGMGGSYQHMDRYLFHRYGLHSGGDSGRNTQGVTITVAVPFETGRKGWSEVINQGPDDTKGHTIEHESE